MARHDVGHLTSASSVSTHSGGFAVTASKVGLLLAGTTALPDTTFASVAAVGVGWGNGAVGSTETQARFGSWFQNSSAKAIAAATTNIADVLSTDGGSVPANMGLFGGEVASTSIALQDPPSGPLGFAVIGGSEFSFFQQGTSGVAVSTLVSTQASTGYGFTPNAAIVLGQSLVSSVANFSFGFACVDTLGNRSQWSVSQAGREAGNAHAHRSASTVSALKLHTTATTAHDVEVTSFRSDGLELTVNATDPARAATISILGLNVPKANAGKATISTLGVASVSGIGQNVGLVIVASIGSSLQTLQDHNCFSIGFASSNGNQRSVSGVVVNGGGASTRYGSYFNTTRVVTFLAGSSAAGDPFSGSSVTAPPALAAQGLFALSTATSGFTITFDTTGVAGKDLYWAALSNVVADIGASIQSSFNANAGPKEVGHIGANIPSSFTVLSGPKEVGHIGAAIQAAFTEALGLTPDFFPGEGLIRGHSEMETRLNQDISQGLGRGQSEEVSDRFVVVQENSSSPDLAYNIAVSTERARLRIAEYGNAKFLTILPPSTNTVPLRLSAGRGGVGMPIGNGMSMFTIADRGGSDAYLFTTASGTTVEAVRVLLS